MSTVRGVTMRGSETSKRDPCDVRLSIGRARDMASRRLALLSLWCRVVEGRKVWVWNRPVPLRGQCAHNPASCPTHRHNHDSRTILTTNLVRCFIAY